jgi:hypothetical protein
MATGTWSVPADAWMNRKKEPPLISGGSFFIPVSG